MSRKIVGLDFSAYTLNVNLVLDAYQSIDEYFKNRKIEVTLMREPVDKDSDKIAYGLRVEDDNEETTGGDYDFFKTLFTENDWVKYKWDLK